jgi:hypothetical protein
LHPQVGTARNQKLHAGRDSSEADEFEELTKESLGRSGEPEGTQLPINHQMGVSINEGTPIAGWFIMDNTIKMDDLGAPLILGNLQINLGK